MTKFSVILPTYNVGEYIDRCLISCINQTYTDFEIIVVDDCGNDDAIDKAKVWAKKDSRIKILHHEKNLGTYHARHTGVKFASGEYVVFLDPDDALEPNALEELCLLTVTEPDVLLFGSRYVPEKKVHQVQSNTPEIINYVASAAEVKKLLSLKGFNLGTLGKAYNKKIVSIVFESLSVSIDMRLIYGEDVLLFSEVIAHAKSIKSTQSKIYVYYQEEGSVTKSTDLNAVAKNIEQLKYVICKLKDKADSTSKNNSAYSGYTAIINRLSADMLVLENKTNVSFFKVMGNYFILAVLTKNFRWIAKVVLYVLTLGKIRY